MTMSVKKNILNRFFGNDTAASEICVAAVLQNNIECKNIFLFIFDC